VGLYKAWTANMDEGWTRFLLEQFGFAYTSLRNADVQAGNLRGKFDVIVFPDATTASMDNGQRSGSMPPEFCGGLGEKGAAALKQFAESGGTLVFLNKSSEYAIQHFGLAAKNVTGGGTGRRSSGSSEFYCPGSLLNARLDKQSPLAYGLPADLTIWAEQSPAFDTQLPSPIRYVEKGLLASGWLLGEKTIAGQAALVDAPLGKGRVILFGMKPQYRAQGYLTFKLFFNSLLYF
jgi:hypothetical protein